MDRDSLQVALREMNPPQPLCQQVFSCILSERRHAARQRMVLQSIFCFTIGLALVPLIQYAGHEFFNSGFYEYALLFFSDSNLILSSWRVVAYALIESLPSIPLLLIILCCASLVWSLRLVVRNSRIAFMTLSPH